MNRKSLIVTLTITLVAALAAGQAIAQVSNASGQAGGLNVQTAGAVTKATVQGDPAAGRAHVDFVNAKGLDLPRSIRPGDQLKAFQSPLNLGVAGSSAGAKGTGVKNQTFLGTPSAASALAGADALVQPQEFGTSGHPFNTARVDTWNLAASDDYPNSPAGKLFFNIGSGSYVCSASLIKRGIAVTAAHCVAAYGQNQFYNNWQFVPGYRWGSAPFGVWSVQTAFILTKYYNGTDNCAVYGVVCPDDVAILVLAPQNGYLPGTSTGWFGYGWDGYGFAWSITQITQLGYPVGLDWGLFMERNDSYGYVDGSLSYNTIIGSLMTGGSSGGPWLVNHGIRPYLNGTTPGYASDPEVVVGVTSWGYTDPSIKEQGAAPFTSGNITVLVGVGCSIFPANCS